MDDPGLGKTAQTVVAFDSLGAQSIVIVCPPAVKTMWEDQVPFWSKTKRRIHVVMHMHEWIPDEAQVVILGYSNLLSPMILDQLLARRWAVGVADEIHFCSNPDAKRTKALLGTKGLWTKCGFFWGLTGTPMTNTPVDLYPLAATIGRKVFKSESKWYWFTKRYCGRYKTRFGYVCKGATNQAQLRKKLFDSGMCLRRLKSDVLDELPDRQYRIIRLNNTGRKEITWNKELKVSEFGQVETSASAAEIAQLRFELGWEKVSFLIDYASEVLNQREKIIIFTWHRKVTESLAFELYMRGYETCTYYGSMTPKAKEKSKRSFTHGSSRVFIANIASAGTGIDGLQHVCDYAIYAELPWTFVEIMQSTDRIWRIGQTKNVISDLPVIDKQVEHKMIVALMKKQNVFSNLLLTSG